MQTEQEKYLKAIARKTKKLTQKCIRTSVFVHLELGADFPIGHLSLKTDCVPHHLIERAHALRWLCEAVIL